MFEILFKIWYTIAILPFLIFIEGSKMFSNFLKKKKIYIHWDILHSSLVVLIIVLIILWINGYR
ncbi:MAG: hypothetical protein WC884_02655 [Candidatus Paceibacterota bacterium]